MGTHTHTHFLLKILSRVTFFFSLSLLTFFSSFFLSFFLFSFRQHFLGRVPVPVQPWTRRGRHAADLYRFSHKSSCFLFLFLFFSKTFSAVSFKVARLVK